MIHGDAPGGSGSLTSRSALTLPSFGSRAAWVLIGAAFLVGAGLRVWHAETSFWVDEVASAERYFDTSPTAWLREPYHPSNHPLFSIGAWLGWQLFEHSEFAARLPSLLAGLGVVAVGWLLVRRLHGTTEAWVFATLMALAHTQIRYSSEARGYELATFLMLVSLYLVVRALDEDRLTPAFAAVIPATLGAFTHIYSALFLAIPALFWLTRVFGAERRRRRLRHLSAWLVWGTSIVALTWLVYRPMIDLVDAMLVTVGGGEAPRALSQTARYSFDGGYVRDLLAHLGNGSGSAWAVAIMVLMWLVGVTTFVRDKSLLALHVGPVVVVLVAWSAELVFYPRFFVVLQPVVLAAMATGFVFTARAISRQQTRFVAVVAAVAFTVPPLLGQPGLPAPDRPWAEVAEYIADGSTAPVVLAYPLRGKSYSVIRRAAGYYLRPYGVEVRDFTGDLSPGTVAHYVTLRSYPPDPDWNVATGEPRRFGDILVYRVKWTGSRFLPAGSARTDGSGGDAQSARYLWMLNARDPRPYDRLPNAPRTRSEMNGVA